MTIAAIWEEDDLLWCAADTRFVAGSDDEPTTDLAPKIYAIPVVTRALDEDLQPRQPHYWTEYGFVYAGAALPASMTAITASTLLQRLGREGPLGNPPRFEAIAELVYRLAKRFISERRQRGGDGLFSAAFFGWCPHVNIYKVAYIDARDDAGTFRVELSYPSPPSNEGDPWLVLGTGASAFTTALAEVLKSEAWPAKRVPRHAIDKIVSEEREPTVGGATSIAFAHRNGFELCPAYQKATGLGPTRPLFNGLDLETDIGSVGQYDVTFFTSVA